MYKSKHSGEPVIQYGRMSRTPEQLSEGSGWSDIILRLIDDLLDLGWDGQLAQIKEKFGGLRFYIHKGNDAIWDRIQQAENESFKTCEDCGQPGKIRHGGWLRTLCDTHHGEQRTD